LTVSSGTSISRMIMMIDAIIVEQRKQKTATQYRMIDHSRGSMLKPGTYGTPYSVVFTKM